MTVVKLILFMMIASIVMHTERYSEDRERATLLEPGKLPYDFTIAPVLNILAWILIRTAGVIEYFKECLLQTQFWWFSVARYIGLDCISVPMRMLFLSALFIAF